MAMICRAVQRVIHARHSIDRSYPYPCLGLKVPWRSSGQSAFYDRYCGLVGMACASALTACSVGELPDDAAEFGGWLDSDSAAAGLEFDASDEFETADSLMDTATVTTHADTASDSNPSDLDAVTGQDDTTSSTITVSSDATSDTSATQDTADAGEATSGGDASTGDDAGDSESVGSSSGSGSDDVGVTGDAEDSTDTSDGGSSGDTGQDCEVEVCMEYNSGGAVDPAWATKAAWYGLRYDPPADRRVVGARVLTGDTTQSTTLGLWSDLFELMPDVELSSTTWTMSAALGWQGGEFAAPVDVFRGVHYWIVWDAPLAAQAPIATTGVAMEYLSSEDAGQNWSVAGNMPWMLRIECCVAEND